VTNKGRPKGSKNKPNPIRQDFTIGAKSTIKPTIKLGKHETEYSIIQKTRYALRTNNIYIRNQEVARAVWGSKSYDSENIRLAINAVKQFVEVIQ